MLDKISGILNWLESYKDNGCHGVVIGMSGGKDSTVVAMLAKKVWGDDVYGVIMPNGEQSDIDDATYVCSKIGIRFNIININDVTTIINKLTNASDKASQNIPPRVRMTILYAIAQTMGYRVIGTGNKSESYIGWTTKWGDSAYDLNPIYHLKCTEVIEIGKILAKEYNIEDKYIDKKPSDGLTGISDEDNFGFNYTQLDAVIDGSANKNAKTIVPTKIVDRIKLLHNLSEHKRKMPVTFEVMNND